MLLALALLLTSAFAVQASSAEDGQLPVQATFEQMGATVDRGPEYGTIHIRQDENTFVLHTNLPLALVNDAAIFLWNGIALSEGKSFISPADFELIQEIVAALAEGGGFPQSEYSFAVRSARFLSQCRILMLPVLLAAASSYS